MIMGMPQLLFISWQSIKDSIRHNVFHTYTNIGFKLIIAFDPNKI